MKLIIAGSRTISLSPSEVSDYVWLNGLDPQIIVCGMARGIDMSGYHFANEYEIPVEKFPADWDTHGKAAGYIRNREMAEYADALLLIWDGSSRGSANMKKEMQKLGKPICEVTISLTPKQTPDESL